MAVDNDKNLDILCEEICEYFNSLGFRAIKVHERPWGSFTPEIHTNNGKCVTLNRTYGYGYDPLYAATIEIVDYCLQDQYDAQSLINAFGEEVTNTVEEKIKTYASDDNSSTVAIESETAPVSGAPEQENVE